MRLLYLAFGIAFGFLLSRSRATDYNAITGMFRFTDLHVMIVIAVAILTAALGLAIVRRRATRAVIGCGIHVEPKPSHRYILPAGLVFGTGWALSGG